LTNSERQRRFRQRKRAANDARNKLIIDARLGTLSAKQRAIAAAALNAVSEILTGTTNGEGTSRGHG
jgi:hypothetical protein